MNITPQIKTAPSKTTARNVGVGRLGSYIQLWRYSYAGRHNLVKAREQVGCLSRARIEDRSKIAVRNLPALTTLCRLPLIVLIVCNGFALLITIFSAGRIWARFHD